MDLHLLVPALCISTIDHSISHLESDSMDQETAIPKEEISIEENNNVNVIQPDQETVIPKEEEISIEEDNNVNVIQPAVVAEQDNSVSNGGITSLSSEDSSSEEEEESEEIESRNRQLLEAHPLKRKGISQYYNWGAKSFNHLGDALGCTNIQEIAREETSAIRQRKRIRMLTGMDEMETLPSD